MTTFVSGMITMGFLVSGLFFLRFWLKTGDTLFVAFAGAFWLLAANQILLRATNAPVEEQSWIFLLRLAAFGIIMAAVVAKNWRSPR